MLSLARYQEAGLEVEQLRLKPKPILDSCTAGRASLALSQCWPQEITLSLQKSTKTQEKEICEGHSLPRFTAINILFHLFNILSTRPLCTFSWNNYEWYCIHTHTHYGPLNINNSMCFITRIFFDILLSVSSFLLVDIKMHFPQQKIKPTQQFLVLE